MLPDQCNNNGIDKTNLGNSQLMIWGLVCYGVKLLAEVRTYVPQQCNMCR